MAQFDRIGWHGHSEIAIPKGQAYAWSCSRMGGWAQACCPIMKTTVTISRLKRRGYIEFYDYFQRFNHKGNYKLDLEFIY
jgi:hypothetical protein